MNCPAWGADLLYYLEERMIARISCSFGKAVTSLIH